VQIVSFVPLCNSLGPRVIVSELPEFLCPEAAVPDDCPKSSLPPSLVLFPSPPFPLRERRPKRFKTTFWYSSEGDLFSASA